MLIHACVYVCVSCCTEKPAAGPVASLTVNELGSASASVGAERALSPARPQPLSCH